MKRKRKLIAIIPTSNKTSEQMSQVVHKILKKKIPKMYNSAKSKMI